MVPNDGSLVGLFFLKLIGGGGGEETVRNPLKKAGQWGPMQGWDGQSH